MSTSHSSEFPTAAQGATEVEARRWLLVGRVQGVGFRPFVYRLARRHGLSGWVLNRKGQVEIHAQGPVSALVHFEAALFSEAPPLSRPRLHSVQQAPVQECRTFRIRASTGEGEARIHVPPDCFTCEDCLAELRDPADRRHRYPFINCTQCGPRYTLIVRLPYDRPRTSMAAFALCEDCEREYRNPADRRFHAEPLACPVCGPALRFVGPEGVVAETQAALAAGVRALRQGAILAVKGVGGYHLLCDAANAGAIERLRRHKPRPHKPLAVLFPQPQADPVAEVRRAVQLDEEMARWLLSPVRPIVLAPRRTDDALPEALAPGLKTLGVMLPYSPLHHLLLDDFGGPLVATSGNVGGDPVITRERQAEALLGQVADAFLHHDRPILRPADDPVLRPIAGGCRPLRLGRGNAPLELELPFRLPRPVLAVGGHMKNSLALGWDDRVVLSPHIGDMESVRSRELFQQVAADLQALYGVRAEILVADAHRGYATRRWAEATGLPLVSVWHHHAHASALAGEVDPAGDWILFTWDGVGLGPDGTLWGGEALVGRPGAWVRRASLRPFRLPGGERAGREPWRSALAMAWEIGLQWRPPGLAESDLALLHRAWKHRLNSPATSAVGRLFDAAAAWTGLCLEASYEGQAPAWLEAAASRDAGKVIELPLAFDARGVLRADWAPLARHLLEAVPAADPAATVHTSLAYSLRQQAVHLRAEYGIARVGLAGGVFQNAHLAGLARGLLEEEGFEVHLNREVPMNDGGLCFGQVVEFACGGRAAESGESGR